MYEEEFLSEKLQHFTFRYPTPESMKSVAKTFPTITSLRIFFNAFEVGLSVNLDNVLTPLDSFEAFEKKSLEFHLYVQVILFEND